MDTIHETLSMKRNINSLIGFSMEALDGEIGKIEDFYFDDRTWDIRYLILKTGSWLSGRKVLISPAALVKDSWEYGSLPVQLTMEQVRNSPDIDTDKPVSRQQEIALHDHYPWESYWGSGYYPGGVWGIIAPASVPEEEIRGRTDLTAGGQEEDRHLWSTHAITGFDIYTPDGRIGHLVDFVIGDQGWQVTELVVALHNWPGGKKVLIPVSHIRQVQWEHSTILTDLSVDAVKESPAFDKLEYALQEGNHKGPEKPYIHLK